MPTDHNIEILLERYWAGETTLKEEQQVQEHLLSIEGSKLHPEAAALSAYFQQERGITSAKDFTLPKAAPTKVRSMYSRYRAIAAVIVLALGLFFFLPTDLIDRQSADTFQTPDEAYAEVVEALQFISGKMNSGLHTAGSSLDKVQPLNDLFK